MEWSEVGVEPGQGKEGYVPPLLSTAALALGVELRKFNEIAEPQSGA
jgi:hypothetical protein